MINEDDPTQSLPDKNRTTQPTLEAILNRLQGFETRIFEHLQLLEARFESRLESEIASLREELTAQITALRNEMNSQFRLVANKIDVLNEDSLSLRASQRELLKRMTELETRPS